MSVANRREKVSLSGYGAGSVTRVRELSRSSSDELSGRVLVAVERIDEVFEREVILPGSTRAKSFRVGCTQRRDDKRIGYTVRVKVRRATLSIASRTATWL